MGNASSRVVGNQMILVLDGHEVGTVKYLSGGYPASAVTEEGSGATTGSIRHVSTVEIEPFSIDAGVLREVNTWIKASLDKHYNRRTFQLIKSASGAGGKSVIRDSYDSLITEIGFPALDRRSGGDAFLNLKVLPERIKVTTGDSPKPASSPPIVPFTGNQFRLSIDGVLDGNEVQKIEGFTIKQGVKKMQVGADRFATVEPTKIEFPNLTFTLAATQAKRLQDWYEEGQSGERAASAENERNGRLELFSRGKSVALAVKLTGLGMVSLAGSNSATAKAEVYCTAMSLDTNLQ